MTRFTDAANQARNQRRRREAKPPLEKFYPPSEKCAGHNLKLLDIVQKFWAPLRKLFTPPGVPSWLRACCELLFQSGIDNFGYVKQNVLNCGLQIHMEIEYASCKYNYY